MSVEVRPDGAKGRGLFASRNIAMGEIAVVERHLALVPNTGTAYDSWLFDWDADSLALCFGVTPLVNHAADPSTFRLQGRDAKGDPYLALVARRDIAEGAPVTIRYGGGVARCDLPKECADEMARLAEIAAAAELKASAEEGALIADLRDFVIVPSLDEYDRLLVSSAYAEGGLKAGKIDGDRIEPEVRSTGVGWIRRAAPGELGHIVERFDAAALQIAAALRIASPRPFEDLQVARYRAGDFYVDHADDGVSAPRRLSVSALLSNAGDFAGGAFSHEGRHVTLKPGEAIGFHSRAMHGVRPVTAGARWSLTGWYA